MTLANKSPHILRQQVRTSREQIVKGKPSARAIAEQILRDSLDELRRRGLTP